MDLPAMLRMLASPVVLLTIAYVFSPQNPPHENLGEYQSENLALPWRLATVIVGTLFRPIAFGMPLFVVDRFSALPSRWRQRKTH